tara:strand:- start:38 stop:577 length:540 start_codon:yes stop_codon:yes gene_type:complete
MEDLKQILKNQKEIYSKNNTFEINLCNNKSPNITELNIDEELFYKTLREYRNYKLNYSQGKYYQDLNQICITSCNRNSDIYKYNLLERENLNYNGKDILIINKESKIIDIFTNNLKYIIEENYEVLTVHINENLKINFEIIGDSHQIKINLKLEKDIPNTYFEEYLKEIDKIIQTSVFA